MLPENLIYCRLDGLTGRSPAAADAQMQHRRHQQQGFVKGFPLSAGNADSDFSGRSFHRAAGQRGYHGKVRADWHGCFQNPGGDVLRGRKAGDMQPLACRPGIHRKFLVDVRGSGNHRGRPQEIRQFHCQRICSANMSGKQRNRESCQLIHGNNRRIRQLAFYMWRDFPDGDAAGADKNQSVRPVKQRAIKGRRRTLNGGKARFRKPLHGKYLNLIALEVFQYSAGGFTALTTVCKQGDFHWPASRNSVEKSGAYRRLRS